MVYPVQYMDCSDSGSNAKMFFIVSKLQPWVLQLPRPPPLSFLLHFRIQLTSSTVGGRFGNSEIVKLNYVGINTFCAH